MVVTVIYALAVAEGLAPVVGAAPYEVIARQLPRLLVVRLNDGGDRGVRFFPFLGTVDGTRGFLLFRQPLPAAQLAELHRQGDAQLLFDGILRHGVLHWRAIDGRSHKVVREVDLPFDPKCPTDVLPRLEFEIMDLLGWSGRPHRALGVAGEALGWFLILKDSLLRREASLVDVSATSLRSMKKCAELAPDDPDVAEAVMDLAVHVLRAGDQVAEIAGVLRSFVNVPELPSSQFERLAALLATAGDDGTAATAALRAARACPERSELVERAVGLLFRVERYGEAAELVEVARQRGTASITALAQYAACCDRTGDQQKRVELCDEMLAKHDLPLPVARLLVSFLLEDERAYAARLVAERALAKDPAQPIMHFELGRACLSLDDDQRAMVSLREAIERGLPADLVPRAHRLLRLASQPGLWQGSQVVERALARGDLPAALRAVTGLARKASEVAEVWFLVGLVRHKLGQHRRAERALRRAVAMDDSLADAHNRLGILLVAQSRVDEGLPHLQRAHALAPREPSPMLHLAQALALLGRIDEAQRLVDGAAAAGADEALVRAVRHEISSPKR